MATLLYYTPGNKTVSPQFAVELGITGGNCDGQIENRGVNTGPDNKSGCVFSFLPANDKGKISRVGYYPDNQIWQDAGKFWIGREKDAAFIPADFERRETISGHLVKLEDGNEYLVPVGRIFPQGTVFPSALILGPGGEMVQEPLSKYARLIQHAERIFETWLVELGLQEAGKYPEWK
jgi:hypothetical protein